MLDDLRNSSSFQDEEEPEENTEEPVVKSRSVRRKKQDFLGMTPPQRFVLALILFMMVCVVGALFLVLFEKVVLPL